MSDEIQSDVPTDSSDINSALSDIDFQQVEEKASEPKDQQQEDADFLKDTEEKNGVPAEEEKTEEVKEEDYTWSPPEDLKGQWESIGETGQQEFNDFQRYAKEKGIKGDVFKELMDKYVKNVPSPQKTTEALAKEWGETLTGWHKEILADKEVGGQNYRQSKESAILAVKELGGKDLANELTQTGFGNNPKLFKFLAKVGDMMREGNFVRGGSPKQETKLYDNMYPTMK